MTLGVELALEHERCDPSNAPTVLFADSARAPDETRVRQVFFFDRPRLKTAKTIPTMKITVPKTNTWGGVPTREAP